MTEFPEDQPAVASPEASPGPAAPTAVKRADWTGYLTPLAVLVGSLLIAGAIWLWGGDDSGANGVTKAELDAALAPLVMAQAAANQSQLPAAAAAPASPASAEATFSNYAMQLGIDNTRFSACIRKPETVTLLNNQLQRGVALGVSGTPTFFINNKMVVGAQPAVIFDEIIAAELSSSPTAVDGYSDNIKRLAANGQFKIIDGRVDVSDATIEGNPNARVMIAEFSDFQCPFCKQWTDTNVKNIRTKLGTDVAFAFLHFPIVQIHPNAANAGAAAICAGEQGKFWQMHDLLFARQKEWEALK
ncbi:MAG: DsbA family protein [Dehalococcoidia bacterium]